MTATYNAQPVFLNVNLNDVKEVKTIHLPDAVLMTADFKQLQRRGAEIVAENDHLKEEVPAILYNEKLRRARLATIIKAQQPMQVSHRGALLSDHFTQNDTCA